MSNLELLKEKVLIGDVLSKRYGIDIDKKKTVCPICGYDEKDRLAFWRDGGHFYCHHCKKGGDIIDLVQYTDGVDFHEALNILAGLAGITIEPNPEYQKRHEISRTLENFVIKYQKLPQPAYDYLIERGLSPETIERNRLGWVPEDALPEQDPLLIEMGLPYLFRGRILIPSWRFGKINYLIGRSLDGAPKYLYPKICEAIPKRPFFGTPRGPELWITEGPFDLLLAQQFGLNAIALGGSSETPTIDQKIDKLVLAFDFDKAGENFTEKHLNALAFQHKNIYIVQFDDAKDLAEYLSKNKSTANLKLIPAFEYAANLVSKDLKKKPLLMKILAGMDPLEKDQALNKITTITNFKKQGLKDELTAFKKTSEVVPAPFSSTLPALEQIQSIRMSKGMSTDKKQQLIKDIIVDYLHGKGSFLRDPKRGQRFFFSKQGKQLMPVISLNSKSIGPFESMLAYELGILKKEMFEIMFHLQAIIDFEAQIVSVNSFTTMDEENNLIFVNDFAGGYFEIGPRSITQKCCDIGGKLFLNQYGSTPILPDFGRHYVRYFERGFDYSKFSASLLYRALFPGDSFASNENKMVMKKTLILIFFISQFFASIMNARPILLLVGKKGSAKSSTARAMGKIIFGEEFDVLGVPRTAEDLLVAALHNPLLVLDNLDTVKEWLSDELARLSTGVASASRKRYTDTEQSRFRPDTFIIATSRNPFVFRRDDVSERTLCVELLQLNKKIPQRDLIRHIEGGRNELLGELFTNLQDILQLMEEYKGACEFQYRMADFAKFVHVAMGDARKAEETLDFITSASAALALDDCSYFEQINQYLSKYSDETLEGHAGDIFTLLQFEPDLIREDKLSSKKLGRWLVRYKQELSVFFKISIAEDKKLGQKYYKIMPKDKENQLDSEGKVHLGGAEGPDVSGKIKAEGGLFS